MCRHRASPGRGFFHIGVREEFFVRPILQLAGADAPGVRVLAKIDTGADVSVIRSALAREAGLKPAGQQQLHLVAGVITSTMFLAQLACSCGRWRPVRLYDDGAIEREPDLEIPEMLIGLDLLRFMHLDVDGPAGQWTLDIDHDAWPSDVESLAHAVGRVGDR